MTRLQRYQLKRTRRTSLWLLPVLAIVLALVVAPLIRWIDRVTGLTWFNFAPEGARTILGAFTTSMLTFVVFVVSSLLIVVQLASAQLTPRIIAMVFADWRLRWVLSAFTFAYTFTIAASGRIEDTTPQLFVALAIVCNLVCISVFFWFVQWLGGSLRPIAVLQAVASEGRTVAERVYPEPFDPAEEQQGWSAAPESDVSTVEHVGTSGVVLGFDQIDLMAIAERADVVIELVPQVGDFVARGDPLFRVRSGGRPVDANALRASVAMGVLPKYPYAALCRECLLVDCCVKSSSSSASVFNTARHSGGVQRQSVLRSLAIAARVCSMISFHRPETTAARSWNTASALSSVQ
jgi:uncharacterized membrane protein